MGLALAVARLARDRANAGELAVISERSIGVELSAERKEHP